MQKVRYS